jgi:Metallo-beta-lactamase superfamily
MKQLHRDDLFGWSEFNEERNLDFHSVLWVLEEGNVLVDPLPLSDHDRQHLQVLGGASYIVITNSDHLRDAEAVAVQTGAQMLGPIQERDHFPIPCERWLQEGDEVVPGLRVFEMAGSKTPGELALLLDGDTLITGDLIRAHSGGRLCLLPDAKLTDKAKAVASVKRLATLPSITNVLPGDGWPVFGNAEAVLQELVRHL